MFVKLQKYTLNTDKICSFWWADGNLYVLYHGAERTWIYEDEDKASYEKLSKAVGCNA